MDVEARFKIVGIVAALDVGWAEQASSIDAFGEMVDGFPPGERAAFASIVGKAARQAAVLTSVMRRLEKAARNG